MSTAISQQVAEQAMLWQLELQEPNVDAHILAACRDWRQAHPTHEQAWQRAEQLARRFSDMRQPRHHALARATLAPDLLRRSTLKSLGLLLAAGGSAWAIKDHTLFAPLMADYHSGVGEQRTLQLAGNLQVRLNTDTAINVRIDPQVRRINLLRGEMLVIAGAEAHRPPLRVETAQGFLASGGGRFSVRQHQGYSQLGVIDGAVVVEPRLATRGASTLAAGQRVNFSDREVFARRDQGAAELAWTQGMIVAENQRLDEFVQELSRYRRGHLGCDPALAELRVSGTYPLADTDRVLAAVGHTLQVEVHHLTRYWVTLTPRRQVS